MKADSYTFIRNQKSFDEWNGTFGPGLVWEKGIILVREGKGSGIAFDNVQLDTTTFIVTGNKSDTIIAKTDRVSGVERANTVARGDPA